MSVTIELSPETEADLVAIASARGLALPQLVRRLLEDHVVERMAAASLSARTQAWRDVKDLPLQPPLSDEAVSRDNLYRACG